jgi:hypothetical protein
MADESMEDRFIDETEHLKTKFIIREALSQNFFSDLPQLHDKPSNLPLDSKKRTSVRWVLAMSVHLLCAGSFEFKLWADSESNVHCPYWTMADAEKSSAETSGSGSGRSEFAMSCWASTPGERNIIMIYWSACFKGHT